MITGVHKFRRQWQAPLALMLLLLVTETLGDSGRQWLAFDRSAIESGQIWRLLTGNLVHLGWWHWFLNELGLVVLVLLCPQPLPGREWAQRVILLALSTSVGLYLAVPGLGHYVGMSGVIHGLFVLGLLPQARRGDLIAVGCLLYLFGKIGWELYAGAPVSDEQAIGGHVIVESHLFGVLGALGYALLCLFRTRGGSAAKEIV